MILLTNPEVDAITRYLKVWSDKLVNDCKIADVTFRLTGSRATRQQVESILEKKSIDIVLFNGHGASDKILGENYESLIDEDNASLLKGKTVHALSCGSARTLGPQAIKHGAKAYVGYDDKFIAVLQDGKLSNPLSDDTAALFLDPAFIAPKALINRKSPEEAVTLAKRAFNRSIIKALTSNIQSDNDQFVKLLTWNRNRLKSC